MFDMWAKSWRFFKKNKDALEEIGLIEQYFKDDKLISFYKNYNELIQRKKLNNFTYWGINFKDSNVLSVKFYAHIIGDVSEEEVLKFIPTSKDFIQFIHLRNKVDDLHINKGVALEIKFKIDSNHPHYGFFFMLNKENMFEKIEYPEKNVHLKDRCVAAGINFEYFNREVIFKRYFYYLDEVSNHFFKRKFGVNAGEDDNLIEYSESDVIAKVNIYGNTFAEIGEKTNIFSKKERRIIQYFNQKYALKNMGYGIYQQKDIKSIYFFDINSSAEKDMYYNTLNKIIKC